MSRTSYYTIKLEKFFFFLIKYLTYSISLQLLDCMTFFSLYNKNSTEEGGSRVTEPLVSVQPLQSVNMYTILSCLQLVLKTWGSLKAGHRLFVGLFGDHLCSCQIYVWSMILIHSLGLQNEAWLVIVTPMRSGAKAV